MRRSRVLAVAVGSAVASVLVAWMVVPEVGAALAARRSSDNRARSAQTAPAAARPYCSGEYADDLSALSAAAREFEQRQAPYTYCVRTTAVYECPSYARDGTLRVDRKKVVAHGTAFGYRQQAGSTLFVTNQHVAEWPAVTDDDHTVDDVPPGCKRVSESVKIVENESDAYERDDVPLTRVVTDPALDVAVLRAKGTLAVIPWRIGRSASLRERNVVDIRGFPLGILRATNVGKVVSAHEHDEEHDWDHDDFVVDALLSPGNSGSPVLAVSCRTGELELVGIYHAGYVKGSALNVVVGIDQIRDTLTTLKRTPRARRDDATAEIDPAARKVLLEASGGAGEPFFPFGKLSAAVRARSDGALVFELMGREFPIVSTPILVFEDLPSRSGGFGQIGRTWAGNRQGLVSVDRASLDADAQVLLTRIADALRRDALLAVSYRKTASLGMVSRSQFRGVTRLEGEMRRNASTREDLAQSAIDMAERLCPGTTDANVSLAEILAPAPRPDHPGVAAAAQPR